MKIKAAILKQIPVTVLFIGLKELLCKRGASLCKLARTPRQKTKPLQGDKMIRFFTVVPITKMTTVLYRKKPSVPFSHRRNIL